MQTLYHRVGLPRQMPIDFTRTPSVRSTCVERHNTSGRSKSTTIADRYILESRWALTRRPYTQLACGKIADISQMFETLHIPLLDTLLKFRVIALRVGFHSWDLIVHPFKEQKLFGRHSSASMFVLSSQTFCPDYLPLQLRVEREGKRWEDMEKKEGDEAQKWDRLRDDGEKSKKNKSGVPYNMINLR